jgi:hypothetical protein
MEVRSPNAKRLREALSGHDPVVVATETRVPYHLDLVSSTSPFTASDTLVIIVRCSYIRY